jgi:hypothetical protein
LYRYIKNFGYLKPNAVVGEIGYRLNIADTKKPIPLLAKLDTEEKNLDS